MNTGMHFALRPGVSRVSHLLVHSLAHFSPLVHMTPCRHSSRSRLPSLPARSLSLSLCPHTAPYLLYQGDVRAVAPDLSGRFAVVAKAQDVLARRKILGDHHHVLDSQPAPVHPEIRHGHTR